jgi:plastocyanin
MEKMPIAKSSQRGDSAVWIVVAIVIIVILGAIFFSRRGGNRSLYQSPASSPQSKSQSQSSVPAAPQAQANTVEYTDSGFSPQSLTVKLGTAVTFVNKTSGEMLVASAPHPVHTGYDGTTMAQHCAPGATPSFDECTPASAGGTYTFTFDKAGTWKYHNHIDPTKFGSITVTP